MTSSSHQLVQLSTGVSLEVEITPPSTSAHEETKLAVCLHPWSWLGGRMDDPVLLSLIQPLRESDYHIVRYNSRGVGKSTGWASLTGLSEGEDLEAVVRWALEKIQNVRSVVIIGYSYGSLIASLHPALPLPMKTSHVFISYPLGTRGLLTLFHTNTYRSKLQELIRNPTSNILILYGDQDEFTGASNYENWRKELEHEVEGQSGRLKVVEIKGAGHFWRGRQSRELVETVKQWLQ